MTEVTPQDFDFDAWLDGVDKPQRSVIVYQKAGLIADLDVLAAKIEHADDDVEIEPMLGQTSEADRLRAEYAKLAQQFHDSALTIRVQGLDEDEKLAIQKANPDLEGRPLTYAILAEALVSPKATPAQVEKLKARIGEAQFMGILAAFHQANNAIPAVSADFLPKPSTPGDGGE
jgi:hypothetical protein